jgi:hypothetical protein
VNVGPRLLQHVGLDAVKLLGGGRLHPARQRECNQHDGETGTPGRRTHPSAYRL